jgi:hypothetical protein
MTTAMTMDPDAKIQYEELSCTTANTGGKGSFTLWVHGGFMVGFE